MSLSKLDGSVRPWEKFCGKACGMIKGYFETEAYLKLVHLGSHHYFGKYPNVKAPEDRNYVGSWRKAEYRTASLQDIINVCCRG